MDNVFIERLWRSVKYEHIYLFEHATIPALCEGLAKWFESYNTWRPHETFDNQTPAMIYRPEGLNPTVIDLPAGPFVRIDVTGPGGVGQAELSLGGQTLAGDFALQQITGSGGDVLSVVVTNGRLAFADGTTELLTATEVEGFVNAVRESTKDVEAAVVDAVLAEIGELP